MGAYKITGGQKLFGETSIGGAKNAVLPILASVVLNKGVSVIHNCPNISDTYLSVEILSSIGCKVEKKGSTITVDSSAADKCSVPADLVRRMRSSIVFLGGILGRFNTVKIGYPGGCDSILELSSNAP